MAKFSIFIDNGRLQSLLNYIGYISEDPNFTLLCTDSEYIISHRHLNDNLCNVVFENTKWENVDDVMTSNFGKILYKQFNITPDSHIYNIVKRPDSYKPTTRRQRKPGYYNYVF